jgi:hypothetical protein
MYECPICSEEKLVDIGQSAYQCQHCRASIKDGGLECSACGTINPLENGKCENCQEPLNIFSRVVSRHSPSSRAWRLDQVRQQANALKAAEALSSQSRMEDFLEIDRQREAAQREAALRQKEADRMLFRNVGIGLGVFFAIVVIASLILLL